MFLKHVTLRSPSVSDSATFVGPLVTAILEWLWHILIPSNVLNHGV